MRSVTLRYDSGHPTRLNGFDRLETMLRELGPPVSVRRGFGRSYVIEWLPLFPGVPDPFYELRCPWNDGRTIVAVELSK